MISLVNLFKIHIIQLFMKAKKFAFMNKKVAKNLTRLGMPIDQKSIFLFHPFM